MLGINVLEKPLNKKANIVLEEWKPETWNLVSLLALWLLLPQSQFSSHVFFFNGMFFGQMAEIRTVANTGSRLTVHILLILLNNAIFPKVLRAFTH